MELAWWQIVLGVIVGLLLLMILVIIHELGHAWAAVRNGVKVEEFGLGFPPRAKILGKYKGTLITLNWLPIGGFCQMKDDDDFVAVKKNGKAKQAKTSDKDSFQAANFWVKTKILFAGVFLNLVTAMVIFTILALFGMPKIFPNQFTIDSDNSGQTGTVLIGAVIVDSPADKAGLQDGDVLVAVADKKVELSAQVPDITENNAGKEINIEYRRGSESYTVSTTLNENSSEQGYLGIQTYQKDSASIKATWSAPIVGVVNTFQFIGETFAGLGDLVANLFGGLWGLVTGGGEVAQQQINQVGESVAGPISILGVIFPNALAAGPLTLLWIMGVISLTLTVMNILPIPGLDGGRWYLIAGFKLFKKKLTKEREITINGIGMLVLYGLVIIITISDIGKMF